MDKRLVKTEAIIYDGFAKVLKQKDYNKITIEDILNETGIVRSTFYAHFKTKEELLNSVSNHIFLHVFSHTLTVENTHDFSKNNIFEFTHLITHILYHLDDEKELINSIISNSCRGIFIDNMKEKFTPIAKTIISQKEVNSNVPLTLYINKTTDVFINVIEYWFNNNCQESPERITSYFFELIK